MLAPSALSRLRRSILIVSGMVRVNLYPFTVATSAKPTPVLPLVGSIISPPGLSTPRFSASSIIANAMRSLTLPPGLKYSSFAIRVASGAYFLLKFDSSSKGVLPIRSVSCFAIFVMAKIFMCLTMAPHLQD